MRDKDYERFLAGLARQRAPAVAEAERLLGSERYDEAEQAIKSADSSIYGAIEIEQMYRRRLEHLVAAGIDAPPERKRAEAVFHRAVLWARSTFPEPHTAIEAEQYASAGDTARAELVRILGYDPEPA